VIAATVVALTGIAFAAWQPEQPDPRPGHEPGSFVSPTAVKPAPVAAAGSAAASPARTSAQTTRFGPAPATDMPAGTPQGVVHIAAAPWGEVYVDGAARGVASPLLQLTLPAGPHSIEVRNGDRPPFVAQVDIAPDRPQRISHRFQ
jgi:hypothetical protein